MPFGAMAESHLGDMGRQRVQAREPGRIRMWTRGRMGGSCLVHISFDTLIDGRNGWLYPTNFAFAE